MFAILNSLNIWLSDLLSNKWRRLIFALISGLVLSLSLPAIAKGYLAPFALVAWLGLIPLLILSKSSTSSLRLCLETLVFSMAYHLLAFSWLAELHPLTWQGFSYELSLVVAGLAWLAPSLFHSILLLPFVLVASAIYKSKGRGPKNDGSLNISDILLLTFLWTAIQYKLQFNLAGFSVFSAPLHLLAYSQHQYLALIQICNIIGAIGLELLILVVNLYFSNFFNVRVAQGSLRLSNYNLNQPSFSLHNFNQQGLMGLVLVLLFIFIFSYGCRQLAAGSVQHDSPKLSYISFAIAQANLSAEASRGKHLRAADVLRIMKDKTTELYKEGDARTDIIAWPEGSVPLLISDTLPAELDELKQYADIFVFGSYHVNGSKLYNSNAFVEFLPNGNLLQFYNKINLVPFGEYTPWTSFLPDKLKELAKSSIGTGFDSGSKHQAVINTIHGLAGNSVCFELLFPDLVRKQAAQAEFLINLNDLSWFKSKRAEDAFLAVAKFRAIENTKGLILASNRGTSAGIDACGRIVQHRLLKSHKRSVYNQYGW